MNLLAESELAYPREKRILYEYTWFNGHPLAQIDSGAVTHWTFTDHLGTPWIQTDSAGAVYWRAEYEPYGRVYALRTGNQHQPLRLPGQEAEELNVSIDGNGSSERFYNIFRWYRGKWGRYTQIHRSDPYPSWDLGNYALVSDFQPPISAPLSPSLIPWSVSATTFAKTMCDGCDGFKWEWVPGAQKPPCAEECFRVHEENHIDWFRSNRPGACKGRTEGSNPLLAPGDLEKTECSAYTASLECLIKARGKAHLQQATSECRTFIAANIRHQEQEKRKYCGNAK